jgi:hypothetical protein
VRRRKFQKSRDYCVVTAAPRLGLYSYAIRLAFERINKGTHTTQRHSGPPHALLLRRFLAVKTKQSYAEILVIAVLTTI